MFKKIITSVGFEMSEHCLSHMSADSSYISVALNLLYNDVIP